MYQLRRIGLPSTKDGVPNQLSLHESELSVGRSTDNDIYLDSSELKNFISRHHAIFTRNIINDKVYYILADTSLNGTYVNDVKLSGPCTLVEGDVVKFGHMQGFKMKRGTYCPQPLTEFSFMYSRVHADNHEHDTNIINYWDLPATLPPIIPKVHMYNNNNLVDSPQTNFHYSPDLKCLLTTQESTIPRPTPINGVNKVSPPSIVNTEDIYKSCEQKRITSADLGSSPVVPNYNTIKSETTPTELNESYQPRKIILSTNQNSHAANLQNHLGRICRNVELGKENSGTDTDDCLNSLASQAVNNFHPEENDFVSSCASSDEDIFKDATSHETGLNHNPNLKPTSSIDQILDQVVNNPATVPDLQTTETSNKSVNEKADVNPCQIGQTKKRGRPARKQSGAKTKKPKNAESDSFMYRHGKCSYIDCDSPAGDHITWVQCDDCDKWYHTGCVGCSYRNVKRSNTQFHCGCSAVIRS